MTHIKSISGQLLHLIVRAEDFKPGRVNVSEDHQFLQCALLNLDKGTTFKAHQHIWREVKPENIAQESWCVIKGSVKVQYYDLDGVLMRTEILNAGDATFTYASGHNYEILEDNSLIYEYKSGPYMGIAKDKTFIQ